MSEDNLAALNDLSGAWIERVHEHKAPRMIVLDMDSSASLPTGEVCPDGRKMVREAAMRRYRPAQRVHRNRKWHVHASPRLPFGLSSSDIWADGSSIWQMSAESIGG